MSSLVSSCSPRNCNGARHAAVLLDAGLSDPPLIVERASLCVGSWGLILEAGGPGEWGKRVPEEMPFEAAALVGEFRRRAVLVPLVDGGLMSAEQGGLRWLFAFTSQDTFAAFTRQRDEGPADGEWECASVYGARLLDEVIPALDFPCGVAVDAGSEGGVLLPPVRGIVPPSAALDTQAEGEQA